MTTKPVPTTNAMDAKQRWIMLGIACLCGLTFSTAMQSVPPLLNLIMADINLSYAQAGLLMGFFTLPGVITSIPAGMLADRYGQKSIGIASLGLIIIGTAIFAVGNSLLALVLGRVISGIGAMTLAVLAPQLLAQRFAGREIGTSMGIYNIFPPAGVIVSMNLLSILGESLGWRGSILVSAALPLVTLTVFAILLRALPWRNERTASSPEGFFRGIRLAGTSIWINGVAWLLFSAALISFFTFTPAFLKAAGFTITSAGFITSIVTWPSLVFSPLGGYLIDKIDRKKLIIIVGSLVSAILIFMVPTSTGWILGLMLILGTVQAVTPSAILALVPEVTSPKSLGLGFGIMATCLNLGVVLGPPITGAARDITGSYQASYALMASFSLLIVPAMLILVRRLSKASQDLP